MGDNYSMNNQDKEKLLNLSENDMIDSSPINDVNTIEINKTVENPLLDNIENNNEENNNEENKPEENNNEENKPEENIEKIQPKIEEYINKEYRDTLMEMGFSKNVSEKALFLNQSKSVEIAMTWIEEHQNDADFEEELVITGIEDGPKKSTRTKEEIEAAAKELSRVQHEK